MSELYSDLQCGLSKDHILKEPIALSCGHCICRDCITYHIKIKCKICGVETNRSELQVEKESTPAQKRIKTILSGLFADLEMRATDGINKLKSLIPLYNHVFKNV